MNREESLAFAHVLIGRIREDLLDVAGDSRLNVRKPCLVDGDSSSCADFVLHWFPFHDPKLDANGLQSFDGELDGRERSLLRGRCRTDRAALNRLCCSIRRGSGRVLLCGRPSGAPPDSGQRADKDNVSDQREEECFSIAPHDLAPWLRQSAQRQSRYCLDLSQCHLVFRKRLPVLLVELEHVDEGSEQGLKILAIRLIRSHTGLQLRRFFSP